MSTKTRWVGMAGVMVAVWMLVAEAADQKTIVFPKGTHVERVAPGHCRFWLPDGKVVQLKEFDPETGKVGDVGVFSSAGVRSIAGEKAKLTPAAALTREEASKLPAAEFVEVGDTMIRLPATLEYVVRTDPPASVVAPSGHSAPAQSPAAQ